VYIQDDFELVTFDFVSDPSTEGAYLRPLQRPYEAGGMSRTASRTQSLFLMCWCLPGVTGCGSVARPGEVSVA
jgi:hypothetical protein